MDNSLNPIFENKIAICFCCDNNYLPYLSVAVESLKQSASKDFGYDIVVFCSGIDETTQKSFEALYKSENISLRFLDVWGKIEEAGKNLFKLHSHQTIATYYRLFIPEILKNYKKVVYCDCDLVFLKDLKELCLIDIKDNLIGACVDAGTLAEVAKNTKLYKLYKDTFKISDCEKYFNAGVLVYNIKACLDFNLKEKCFAVLNQFSGLLEYQDQDVLNIVCQGKVKLLDKKYNAEMYMYKKGEIGYQKILKPEYINMLKSAFENTVICHFAGGKPWNRVSVTNSELWWSFAKQTPFYDKFILNLVLNDTLSAKLGKEIIKGFKSFSKCLKLPYTLLRETKKHFVSKNKFKTFPEYKESFKTKETIEYKIGKSFIKICEYFIVAFLAIFCFMILK